MNESRLKRVEKDGIEEDWIEEDGIEENWIEEDSKALKRNEKDWIKENSRGLD